MSQEHATHAKSQLISTCLSKQTLSKGDDVGRENVSAWKLFSKRPAALKLHGQVLGKKAIIGEQGQQGQFFEIYSKYTAKCSTRLSTFPGSSLSLSNLFFHSFSLLSPSLCSQPKVKHNIQNLESIKRYIDPISVQNCILINSLQGSQEDIPKRM